MLFNSQMLAHGEIMVIDGLFAVRVVRPFWNHPPLPFSGQPDDVTEILEFQLRLAAVPMTLTDLAGVGENSIINLGIEASEENNLELVVAEAVIGIGTICHGGGHLFGIKISELSYRAGQSFPVFTSGTIVAEEVKHKGFHHIFVPNKFSKEQVWAVSIIHESVASNLNSIAGDLPDYHVAYVDQVAYHDLLDSLHEGDVCILAESASGLRKQREAYNTKYIVQSKFVNRKLTEKRIAELEGKGTEYDGTIPLGSFLVFIQKDGRMASRIAEGHFLQDFFTSLRNGWKQRYRMPAVVGSVIPREKYESMFIDSEHILIAGLKSDDDSIVAAYPSITLSKIMSVLEDSSGAYETWKKQHR